MFFLIYYQFNKGNSKDLCEPSSIESHQKKRNFQKFDIMPNLWEKIKLIFYEVIKKKTKHKKMVMYNRLLEEADSKLDLIKILRKLEELQDIIGIGWANGFYRRRYYCSGYSAN